MIPQTIDKRNIASQPNTSDMVPVSNEDELAVYHADIGSALQRTDMEALARRLHP